MPALLAQLGGASLTQPCSRSPSARPFQPLRARRAHSRSACCAASEVGASDVSRRSAAAVFAALPALVFSPAGKHSRPWFLCFAYVKATAYFCYRHVVRAIWGSLIVWHSVSMCCGGHGVVVACCLFPALTRRKYHRGAYGLVKRGCLPARPVRLLPRGPFVESYMALCVSSLSFGLLHPKALSGPRAAKAGVWRLGR